MKNNTGLKHHPLKPLLSWAIFLIIIAASVGFFGKFTNQALLSSAVYLFAGLGVLYFLLKISRTDFSMGKKLLNSPSRLTQSSKDGITHTDNQLLNGSKKANFIVAMREIDRAILSNAVLDRVVDVVMRHSQQVISAQLIAVTRFNPGSQKVAESLVLENGSQQEVTHKLDKSIRQFFMRFPEGGLVEEVKGYVFLQQLTNQGNLKFLVNPIYKEGQLDGILTFGIESNANLSAFEQAAARDFADRLGVVKTAAARAKEQTEKEYYDSATQLINRQACYDRLSQEISRARRQRSKLAAFYLNVNDFKKINSAFGNNVGDLVLKEIADRLKVNLREADIISRFGADEFVGIITDIDKAGSTNVIATKIIQGFKAAFNVAGHEINPTIRMGISIFPDDGITAEEVIGHANAAMQNAKKTPDLPYAFYESNMSTDGVWQAKIHRELQHALRNNEFFLMYQPQACTRTGKIVGVEALVRWQHPERGVVSPNEFIPVCEDTGLIIQLGEQVRQLACDQYNLWQSQHIKPPKISLNVSTIEIQHKDFATDFATLLKDNSVPHGAFELEVTETMLVESEGHVIENLKTLSEQGVTIALDDFGTGYSNLSYLIRLPFNILKVDRSFVAGIGKYPGSTEIVTMIIEMAHHLGKVVVAEGIENEMQRKFLVDSGCDALQGYLISKPLTQDDLIQFMLPAKKAQAKAEH